MDLDLRPLAAVLVSLLAAVVLLLGLFQQPLITHVLQRALPVAVS